MSVGRVTSTAASGVLVALLVGGCAPLLERSPWDRALEKATSVRSAAEAEWTEPALVRDGVSFAVLSMPERAPAMVLSRAITLELENDATVQDVLVALANLGYSAIITDRVAADAQVRAPRYQGTLGGLIGSIERAADVWFAWERDAFVVSARERIVLSLPQERKLAERVAFGLQALGLCVSGGREELGVAERALNTMQPLTSASGLSTTSNLAAPSAREDRGAPSRTARTEECRASGNAMLGGAASWEAGMLTLLASPKEYERALTFIKRITDNAAIVNLQVAMVSVTSNEDASRGIDWSRLQLAIDGNHNSLLDQLAPPAETSGNLGGDNSVPSVGAGWSNTGTGYYYNGGVLRGVVSNSAFSMISFVDFLDSYGQVKTLQSVMLRTVTGSEVELKSVTQIPYVTGVGVGATSAGLDGSTGLLGSANTATANDGIILRMSPSFDSASQSVTIDMSLSIHAVLGFQELSAGNQLGKLTQPTTAERTFNDVLRVRPGQTVVVGGITYDRIERANSVPLYLPDQLAHQNLKVKRESMFLVLRPTVVMLGALPSDSLDGRDELSVSSGATDISGAK